MPEVDLSWFGLPAVTASISGMPMCGIKFMVERHTGSLAFPRRGEPGTILDLKLNEGMAEIQTTGALVTIQADWSIPLPRPV